jgi:outer membrane murein-binding lipoprotein Lpp
MNNSYRILIAACVFLVLLFSGCASRPDEQIKLATEAYNQAVDQRAEQYAPSEWKSAKEIWDQANEQLAKQSYAAAAESFITAKARLNKARDVAKDERDSMLTQVKALQTTITENYSAFKAAITPAKKAAAKKEYQAAVEDIDKRIALIVSQVSQGDYIGAKENAQGALQAIDYNQKKLAGGAVKAR